MLDRSLRAALVATSAGLSVGAAPRAPFAQSVVRLDRSTVIELAQRQAPELLVARARVELARASLAGASAWARDNPTLSLAAGPRLLASGEWTPDFIVGVSVPVEVAGVSWTRPRAVRAQVALAEAEADALAQSVAFDALERWVRTAGARARAERAAEQRTIYEQSVRIATIRATRGAAGQGELALATLALSQVSAAQGAEQAEVLASEASLRARLGIDGRASLELVDALEARALPSIEALVAALERSPSIAVTSARAELARREWDALRRTVWPAPRVGLSGGRENEYYLRASLDMGVPLFQRNEGPIAVARSTVALSDAERRSVLATAERALHEAYARARALELVEGAHRAALEQSELVLRFAARAFELGERDATVNIAAMREAYLARRGYTEWLEARALARLAVDRAAGALR